MYLLAALNRLLSSGLVDIKSTGAILLGDSFAIDGYYNRLARVITHAHSDHLRGLTESIQYSSMIIAHPITIELLFEIINMSSTHKYMLRQKAIPLNYNQEIEVNKEILKLLPANHIIGSAQVHVETHGFRLGFTGDFRLLNNTPVMKNLDVLVIEATYGRPEYRRPFKHEIDSILIETVIDGLSSSKPVVIYGYYGKLQEVMKILRDGGIKEPFIMPPKIYRITKIAERYGHNIGNYYNINSREAREIRRNNAGYIMFYHMTRARYRDIRRSVNIILSGWEFNDPVKRVDPGTWLIALSDHADYEELMRYVEKAEPGFVVVDNSREGAAYDLARSIKKELGIQAIVLPDSSGGARIDQYCRV